MSVIRTLASTENPLFSQATMSAAASASRSRCMRNQRTTRRRTFSVSVAKSAWVISRAGSCLRQAACPQEGRRPVTGRHEDAVGRARMEMHVVIERRSEAVQKGHGAESRARCAAVCAIRRPLQDGQTPRPLQLAIGRAGHPWPRPAGQPMGTPRGPMAAEPGSAGTPRQNPARTTYSVPGQIRSRGCHR